ncbi:MAG: TonB-dependent receptor [Bacteroidota bacterium]
MKHFNTLLFAFFILIFQNTLSAQDLRGKVVDTQNSPVVEALIHNPVGSKHSHSNARGEFVLSGLSVGDTVIVSFLGFQTLEYELASKDFNDGIEFTLEEAFFELDQISVSNSMKAINKITSIDLQTDPVNSSQEVLRRVPGLFIGQHAGGGKAEQIFLRGFDIDHGTDIGITVDGMPVNMVSHAHGQGYADLHFLIPETIENIDFGKGPYYTNQGNFNTAGYVDFKTKDKVDQSSIGMEFGQFGTFRTSSIFNLLGNSKKQNAYVASEYILTEGPFDSPQNFNRLNLMAKYTSEFDNSDRLSILISRFQSKWDASGQIPQRLVDNGTISRFGAVDDTEGGNTSRTNFSVQHTKFINNSSFIKTNAFFSHYDFELFSNFTFFLEDPENGDQIRQAEDRRIYGINSTMYQETNVGNAQLELSYGVGLRYDDVNDVGLFRTANRKTTLETLADGEVDESNIFGFVNAEFDFGDWMINAGVRFDAFNFDYTDRLQTLYTSLSESAFAVSPKLSVIYNPTNNLQLYFKSGVGFHSNDTRVVVAQGGEEILPAAYGVDLGTVWKPAPRLWINAAVWYLFLEQEFVYVGDAAIVEPSGKTARQGVDFGLRYQLTNYLFFNADVNYTHARAIDEDEGADRIPLAPELTSMGGLAFRHPSGFSAGIQYRYIRDRPANEDNSIIAEGYFITDLTASYTFKKVTIGFAIENLFDQDWNEAQFATESRLSNEAEPVEELHFTPGVPFFFKGNLTYRF